MYVPWLGLFHHRLRYGISIVNLSRFTLSGAADRRDLENAYYYFNDYGDHGTGANAYLNFLYVTRLLAGGTVVPKGSVFAERSAFLVFKVGDDPAPFADVSRWAEMLRQPVKVEVR